jgi:hypothetical protein
MAVSGKERSWSARARQTDNAMHDPAENPLYGLQMSPKREISTASRMIPASLPAFMQFKPENWLRL